jgi:hypothetical protein
MVVTLIKRTDVDGGDCVDFQIVEEVQRSIRERGRNISDPGDPELPLRHSETHSAR